MNVERSLNKMNKSDINAVSQANKHIKDWCSFLGFPCGNCPFSTPPYDDDGYFEEGVEVCSLDDIIVDGDRFMGYKLPEKKLDELADRGWK